jgi:O-antigen/teichoic acid export membrane protein
VNLLFTPIQSRLIGPELIGFQQSLTSMIGIIIVFTTLKVETLMMHTVNINDQEKYAHAALSLAVRMSIVFGFFISIYWFYTNNQGIATLVAMMIVVPIILFLFAVDNVRKVQQIRNNQAKQYYRLSFLRNSFK